MCNGFCSLTTLCLMVFSNNNCKDNGTTLAVARIGTPVDLVPGSIDTVTGTSGMQISSATLAGSPGMFRLQQRSFAVDNAAIAGTNTKWLVTFNTHQFKATA